MSDIIYTKTKIIIESCCSCGISFGMPEELRNELLSNGKNFFCPNGHSQYFSKKKSLEDKLKSKELALKQERAYSNNLYNEKEDYKREAAAQKGAKTKMLNRINNGVCPHCNRSFENLHEHMKSKHNVKSVK